MSLFETLPDEVLEHLFSFVLESHFPLRQTCSFLRNLLDPVTSETFVKQTYESGDINLVQHYNMPCSQENFEIILRQGHEELFKIRKNLKLTSACLTACAVQGRNDYIINYLLDKGYVTAFFLVYEACEQNYLRLVSKFYTIDVNMYICMCRAVRGEALDVLNWLVSREKHFLSLIVDEAVKLCKVKVLRWVPMEKIKKFSKKITFAKTCRSPNLDMFNFFREIDHLPRQNKKLSRNMVKSSHLQILKTMILEKSWTLTEDMFETALEKGCIEMVFYLLELGCPRTNSASLYSVCGVENLPWLLNNITLTEDAYMNIDKEQVLIFLVQGNHVPDSFKTNPEITLTALEQGFTNLVDIYLETDYTFYENVSLQVDNPASLEWLIENEVGLCPALFYRLVNDAEEELVEKLVEVVDPPDDILDHIQSLIYDKEIRGKGHTRKVAKLENIAEFIREW